MYLSIGCFHTNGRHHFKPPTLSWFWLAQPVCFWNNTFNTEKEIWYVCCYYYQSRSTPKTLRSVIWQRPFAQASENDKAHSSCHFCKFYNFRVPLNLPCTALEPSVSQGSSRTKLQNSHGGRESHRSGSQLLLTSTFCPHRLEQKCQLGFQLLSCSDAASSRTHFSIQLLSTSRMGDLFLRSDNTQADVSNSVTRFLWKLNKVTKPQGKS